MLLAFSLLVLGIYLQADSRNLIGIVAKTDDDGIDKGDQITLVNLHTPAPTVIWPSGVESPLKKIFDDGDLIILQLVASGSGSTDTIYIEKGKKRFLRVAVSIIESQAKNQPLQVRTVHGFIK